MTFALRVAREDDIPALDALIPVSVRALQALHYSTAQMDAALGPVFGVDRELIHDGTYYVVEHNGDLVGCGGWSKRRSLFGSDAGRNHSDSALLDPERDSARIRAFFVHPDWARRGVASLILDACQEAIAEARFRSIELVATLAGEPLYAAFSYKAVERFEIPLAGDLRLPAVRMVRSV